MEKARARVGTGGTRQTGLAVIPRVKAKDATATSCVTRGLNGNVDGLATTAREHAVRHDPRRARRQLLGERGTIHAGEVMVADVDLVKGADERRDHLRIAVAEVEGTAVEMEVHQLMPGQVPHAIPLAAPHHELRAEGVPDLDAMWRNMRTRRVEHALLVGAHSQPSGGFGTAVS